MAINRWLGLAQPRVAKQALQPLNVTPGSTWVLRVGSQTYSYEYPSSIETGGLSDAEMSEAVTDGLVAAYSGGISLGGGASAIVGSVSSELYNGRWSIVVTGTEDGAPLDVELTGTDPIASSIAVIRLQAGRAAQNEIQRIKFPATPTGGTWFVRYKNAVTSALAYNISAANLQTALRGLASIGSPNVTVTGSYTAGYLVEFVGALAATDVDPLVCYSEDFEGVASYKLEVTNRGGLGRQEYTLAKLNGNANVQYRFSYEGDDGHLWTGAASLSLLISALESIPSIGIGNAYVEQLEDGSYKIALIGAFVGLEGGDLEVENVTDGSSVSLDSTTPTLTEELTEVRITFLNMPYCADPSEFTLSYDGATTAAIVFASGGGVSTATINAALGAASIDQWTCSESTGGEDEAFSMLFQYVRPAGEQALDTGVILCDVSGVVGCNAIDVRTTQLPRSARNEVQQINIQTNPTGGTFTLAFGANTTTGIAYNASASTIQTALQGLASVGSGNALVSGPVAGPFIVEFASSLGAASQSLIVGNGSSLTLPTLAGVTELTVLTPTGPNWWTNAGNWSTGAVPTSSDIATFDAGAVDCIYGLQGVPAVGGIDIYLTYSGRIGLPERKDDGTPETLPQYLSLTDGGGTIPIRIGLGDAGTGPTIVRINTGDQDAAVNVLSASNPSGDQLYTIGLAGDMSTLNIGDASVQIATAANLSATIGTLRVSPRNRDGDGAVVEWGEDVDIASATVIGGTVRGGSVPEGLVVIGGVFSVRGAGTCQQLNIRETAVRWLASGALGKRGAIGAIDVSGSQAEITSAAHGLLSGQTVFVRGVVGVVGIPDGYYAVQVVDVDTFILVRSAPVVPFGSISPTSVASFYQANSAEWGLADAVRIGVGGSIDFSESSVVRTVVAPILLQSADARIIDPNITIDGLRWRSDNGFMDADYGLNCVFKREQAISSSNALVSSNLTVIQGPINGELLVAVSDETTNLTTGTAKLTFRMPYAMNLQEVRANVNTAPVGSTIIVDINASGSSILSTKLSIDAGEESSLTAAVPAVISDTSLASDEEITIDIDQIGSSTAGKGLKILLKGTRA